MRRQIIITGFLGLLVMGAILCKSIYLPLPSRELDVSVTTVLWVGVLVFIVFSFNILWRYLSIKSRPGNFLPRLSWPNRRESYRVVYPTVMRPCLILEHSGAKSLRNLEYPILDISEGGLSFLQDGSFGDEKQIRGKIVLKNGERITISAKILCMEGSRVRLKLHRNLPFGLLLQEQRRLIAHNKPQG